MTTWVKDGNGNKCSVEYFGSKEAAQAALDSLKECRNCTNCDGCVGCDDCVRCVGCDGCVGCDDCVGCVRCDGLKRINNETGESKGPPPTPTIHNIHQAIYAAASAPRALEMSNWHTCENTHCRAGWAVTLAGEAGRALEAFYSTSLAAMLIYDASAPDFKINPARFYDSNDDALADMKRLAEQEKMSQGGM